MGHSEVSMKEGDVVELLKIGCAGWWYIKILSKYQSQFTSQLQRTFQLIFISMIF